jgi:hypothetical protein
MSAPPVPPAHEEFLLQGGEGIIELCGDGFDCGLLVEGAPVALGWEDCAGSIGQYLARSRDTASLSARMRTMRQVAEAGIQPGRSLAAQVRPLLQLFTDGRYRLWHEHALTPLSVLTYTSPSTTWGLGGFYPEPEPLIATQAADTLRSDRIEYFGERIRSGGRPVVFAARASAAWYSFVLDGHHKLQAYQDVGLSPSVLFIERQEPRVLTLNNGLQFLSNAEQRTEYRRLKRDHGAIETEEDWLAASDVFSLWYRARGYMSLRKRRLAVCAACRNQEAPLLPVVNAAVETAERFADGRAASAELAEANRAVLALIRGQGAERRPDVCNTAAAATAEPPHYRANPASSVQAELLLVRHLFGNPFRPYPAPASWPALVVDLAQQLYGGADVRLILHDALLDAGHAELAGHFRTEEWHPKGCWVLDLVLGRE